MIVRATFVVVVLNGLLVSTVGAQTRDAGWELGADIVYQDARGITFNGGSRAELDEDTGIAVTFGYRFNERLELVFGLD